MQGAEIEAESSRIEGRERRTLGNQMVVGRLAAPAAFLSALRRRRGVHLPGLEQRAARRDRDLRGALPGREQRIAEPAFTSITSLIEPVTRALGPYLDLPFAFFFWSQHRCDYRI